MALFISDIDLSSNFVNCSDLVLLGHICIFVRSVVSFCGDATLRRYVMTYKHLYVCSRRELRTNELILKMIILVDIGRFTSSGPLLRRYVAARFVYI